MILALDYDGTYTEDPLMWLTVVTFMQSRGHTVIVVTMRTPEQGADIHTPLRELVKGKVYCTSCAAKVPYLDKLGITPDIWIDDNPKWLYISALPANDASTELSEHGLG